MGQILSLQPDLVEIITWNDAGEGHYIGNFWNESLGGSDIGSYASGFDHSGWQKVISPFISAYKSGATDVSQITSTSTAAGGGNSGEPVGVMWYRALLTTASCSNDSLGKPDNWENAQDAINYAVILPNLADIINDSRNYTINVYSNNAMIGSFAGVSGLNGGMVLGLAAGSAESQRVEVVQSSNGVNATTVLSARGTKDVMAETSGICNYNYEVVAMS
jgi:glucan endo-1,3-alpha-glucosidase